MVYHSVQVPLLGALLGAVLGALLGVLLGALRGALVGALVASDSHNCTSVKADSTKACSWVLCKVRKQASKQLAGKQAGK